MHPPWCALQQPHVALPKLRGGGTSPIDKKGDARRKRPFVESSFAAFASPADGRVHVSPRRRWAANWDRFFLHAVRASTAPDAGRRRPPGTVAQPSTTIIVGLDGAARHRAGAQRHAQPGGVVP